MNKKYELHLISHTHWDREWHLPFQQFRMRLVDVIDHLLEILDQDPDYKYFTLDGQTIVLKDYLEIRPENEGRLRNYIKGGRIFIGPWYVLPDEFLVSSEAIVRNLMLGHRIARRFGEPMKVGYVPDTFGHISQLPQIMRGFGIDNIILWRGIGKEEGQDKSEYLWESPDCSRVMLIHLSRRGYSNAANLPEDPAKALERINLIKECCASRATTPYLLLLNGTDHAFPQSKLSWIIEKVNDSLNNSTLVHSNLPQYIEKIKKAHPDLRILKGEFRNGLKHIGLLSGVISTRMYLKQENKKAQDLLEKWAESFSTFAWSLGNSYPKAFLWQSWDYLLQNHPHDSICGCSVDSVHDQMMTRFSFSEEIAEALTERSLKFIAEKIDTSGGEKSCQHIVVFNPLSWERSELIEVEIDFPLPESFQNLPQRPEEGPEEKKSHLVSEEIKGVVLKDEKGEEVTSQLIDKRIVLRKRMRKFFVPKIYKAVCFKVLFMARKVPPCGYRTYQVFPSRMLKEYKDRIKTFDNGVENEYLRVVVKDNGTLDIFDKHTGTIFKNLIYFEDGGDVGDEYNYSYPLRDTIITSLGISANISLVKKGPLRTTFKVEINLPVPASASCDLNQRSEKLIDIPISSYVSLSTESKRVDVTTRVDNKVKDHRLRVLFPSGIATDYSYAEGHYGVTKRAIELSYPNEYMLEKPAPTHPQISFVDVNNGSQGLTIINKGLPEYEVKNDECRTIALTLLRCVGMLSRYNLLTRPSGRAGPPISTPGAQCIGKHTFQYSIFPHNNTWEEALTYRQAHQYNTPCRAIQTEAHSGKLPTKLSFISIEPSELLISAVKKAEDKDELTVRFYNISTKKVEGNIRFYKPVKKASLVNLNEEHLQKLAVNPGGDISLKVKPSKVVSIQFRF